MYSSKVQVYFSHEYSVPCTGYYRLWSTQEKTLYSTTLYLTLQLTCELGESAGNSGESVSHWRPAKATEVSLLHQLQKKLGSCVFCFPCFESFMSPWQYSAVKCKLFCQTSWNNTVNWTLKKMKKWLPCQEGKRFFSCLHCMLHNPIACLLYTNGALDPLNNSNKYVQNFDAAGVSSKYTPKELVVHKTSLP